MSERIVAITGAASGIGEATARLLAARGDAVVLAARRADRLESIAADIRSAGGTAVACAADVTARADVTALVERAVDEFGRLDVMVNNAGIATIGPVADLDVDGWMAMVDVNLKGVLHGVAAALPVFTRQGRGHFVTTVSTSGLKIVPNQSVYAATKNAVRTFLEGFRQECTDGVIRTTMISPGYVNTELDSSITDPEVRRQTRAAMEAFALPADAVAQTIAFAIDQPADVEIGELTVRPARQN
jgi:NADP-dependent 3-hydroxy acid dehydrogenase YdfG